MIIKITDQTFNEEVLKSNIPVLVDFWAEWCGPCHAIAPVLEEIAKANEGKIKIAKLNIDENPAHLDQYRIMSIPNMKLFKGGELVDEFVGVMPRNILENKIKAHLT